MSAPSPDAVREAMEWLARFSPPGLTGGHARTIQALLAEPRMPAEPTAEAVRTLYRAWQDAPHAFDLAYRALYAHLSKPATRTVEVYEVRFALHKGGGRWFATNYTYSSRETCEEFQRAHEADHNYSCWSIVGPITREVPA